MTNWKNLLLLFSLAINIAAAATLVYLWDRTDEARRLPLLLHRPNRDAVPPGPLWRAMDLQESQKRELARFRAPFNERIRRLRFEMDENRRRLMQVLLTKPTEQDSITSLLHQLAKDQAQLDQATIEHLLTLRPYLDERQWRMLLYSLHRDKREGREPKQRNPLKRY